MIGLEDRQSLSQDIGVAHAAGARLHLACEVAGIDLRTLQRWMRISANVTGDFGNVTDPRLGAGLRG
jgi:hypothetical protein